MQSCRVDLYQDNKRLVVRTLPAPLRKLGKELMVDFSCDGRIRGSFSSREVKLSRLTCRRITKDYEHGLLLKYVIDKKLCEAFSPVTETLLRR